MANYKIFKNQLRCICEDTVQSKVYAKHLRRCEIMKCSGEIAEQIAQELSDLLPTNLRERVYSCSFCPYKTSSRQTRLDHENKHRGIKPYHCVCGFKSAYSQNLVRHKKNCIMRSIK